MNRNFNYWSSKSNGNNGGKSNKAKTEAPKIKYSICTKDSLVGAYCDNEEYIIGTDYCDDISIGCLELLHSIIEDIPTNEEEICNDITIIYIPDIISALITGGVADYIRTKKTKGGDDLGEEKLGLYTDIDKMARDRSYNVILRSYGFQDKTFQAKAIAWIKDEVRNATAKANGKERQVKVSTTDNDAIAQLNKKIVELTMAGKFNEAQQVAQILATMSGENKLEVKDEEVAEETEVNC